MITLPFSSGYLPRVVIWYTILGKRASWRKTEGRKSDDHLEKWAAGNKEMDYGAGTVDCTTVYKEKGRQRRRKNMCLN